MARNRGAEVDVDTTVDDEQETVAETTETTEGGEQKAAKAKKEPARGDLPEGYSTPVQLAKVLTDRGLHTNRQGEKVEVRPQMVYSYIKNSPKEDPFPLETIKDSIGKERQVVKTEDGVAWWERKNERVATRRANAQEKADKKAQRAAEKANGESEAEGDTDESVEATEAE